MGHYLASVGLQKRARLPAISSATPTIPKATCSGRSGEARHLSNQLPKGRMASELKTQSRMVLSNFSLTELTGSLADEKQGGLGNAACGHELHIPTLGGRNPGLNILMFTQT